MVALDPGCVLRPRFDDVGIQGPLNEEVGFGEVRGDFFEDPDERLPDDLEF